MKITRLFFQLANDLQAVRRVMCVESLSHANQKNQNLNHSPKNARMFLKILAKLISQNIQKRNVTHIHH